MNPLIVGMFETFDKRIRLPLTKVQFQSPHEEGSLWFVTENLKALPATIHNDAYKVRGWRLDARHGDSGWQRWSSHEGGILVPDELRMPERETATMKLQFRFTGECRYIQDDYDPDHFTLWPASEPMMGKQKGAFAEHVRYNPELRPVMAETSPYPFGWQLMSIQPVAVVPEPKHAYDLNIQPKPIAHLKTIQLGDRID